MDIKKKFIVTQEEDVAAMLRKNSFTFVGKNGNSYTFLNDGKLNFSLDNHKLAFTNILSV